MELKKCPFCGGDDVHMDFSHFGNHAFVESGGLVHSTPMLYMAFCADCGARTMDYEEARMAADAWNRRPNDGT